jgi:hypothetical protein
MPDHPLHFISDMLFNGTRKEALALVDSLIEAGAELNLRFVRRNRGQAHGSRGTAALPGQPQNDPPNSPPTSVLLVLKLKFCTKIFALYSRR